MFMFIVVVGFMSMVHKFNDTKLYPSACWNCWLIIWISLLTINFNDCMFKLQSLWIFSSPSYVLTRQTFMTDCIVQSKERRHYAIPVTRYLIVLLHIFIFTSYLWSLKLYTTTSNTTTSPLIQIDFWIFIFVY